MICASSAAEPSSMASQRKRTRLTGKYPPAGHGRMARGRPRSLQHPVFGRKMRSMHGRCPVGHPASRLALVEDRLASRLQGMRSSRFCEHRADWHDRPGHAVPFTKRWKQWGLPSATTDRSDNTLWRVAVDSGENNRTAIENLHSWTITIVCSNLEVRYVSS